MKPITRKCTCCNGTGRVEVTGVYAETLSRLKLFTKHHDPFVVSNRDAWWFGCKPTALNNRLAVLEKYGLVRSERYGRQRRFYLV